MKVAIHVRPAAALRRTSVLGRLPGVPPLQCFRDPMPARGVLSPPLAASGLAGGCVQGFGMIDDVALAGSKVALTILGCAPRHRVHVHALLRCNDPGTSGFLSVTACNLSRWTLAATLRCVR